MKYLNKIVEKLLQNNVKLLGCDKDKIKKLEDDLGKNLSICYKEFLEKMGDYTNLNSDEYKKYNYNYVGFGGESIFYDDVYGEYTNKDALVEQLKEDGKTDLLNEIDDNVFVFASHQGYIFAFFKLDEGDNPPVYGYHQDQERDFFPKLTETLLDFFEQHLENGKDPYNALDE